MKHFQIQELVPPETWFIKRDSSIELFDPKLIEVLEWVRETIDRPITVNNWDSGGAFKYRGFRPSDCKVGAKFSAHKEGKAVDFDVKGMTAQQVRDWIHSHKIELPHPIRMELGVNWVHFDVKNTSTTSKIIYFNP